MEGTTADRTSSLGDNIGMTNMTFIKEPPPEMLTRQSPPLDPEYVLTVTALALLSLAFVVWLLTWCRNASVSPYRKIPLLIYLATSIVLYSTSPFFVELSFLNKVEFRTLMFFQSVCYTAGLASLLGYVWLGLVQISRNEVPIKEIVSCGILVTLPVVLYHAIFTILEYCTDIDMSFEVKLVFNHCLPNDLLLVVTAFLDAILMFRLLADKSPLTRERRFLRWSSVCLAIFLVYEVFVQVTISVMFFGLGHFSHESLHTLFEMRKIIVPLSGILGPILLCFLDLEVWSCCPCIIATDDYTSMEDASLGIQQLGNSKAAPEEIGNTEGQEIKASHVTSFEVDPRPLIGLHQSKAAYGSVPQRR